MNLFVFFTWDVSLSQWRDKGLLSRELKLYEALLERGVNVTFLTWGGEEDFDIAAKYPQFTFVPFYKFVPYVDNKAVRFLFSFLAPFIIRPHVKPDTIFKTNQMWGVWVAVMAKYLYRRPLLLRTGFELYDFTVRGGHGFARKIFIKCISWIGYKSANHIFVASSEDKKFVMQNFAIKDEKISLCPNWIDTKKFSPKEAAKNGRILFVGRLNAQKNLPCLIHAIKGLKVGLDIIGGGEMERELKALSKDMDVNFIGAVMNDELPDYYRKCTAFILPSLYEGNPKSLLEAMACAAPVIGTRVSGIESLITDQTGFLCPPTENGIQEAIARVLSDPMGANQRGLAARETILANNTLAAQAAREVECLRRLATKE